MLKVKLGVYGLSRAKNGPCGGERTQISLRRPFRTGKNCRGDSETELAERYPGPGRGLRPDPWRSRHRQERGIAHAGRAPVAVTGSHRRGYPSPAGNLADFYRELVDIFAVPLRPSNRWGGFKALRERWLGHLESTRRRPVLFIDESQEMNAQVLCEPRLCCPVLGSTPRRCCSASSSLAMPGSPKYCGGKNLSLWAAASVCIPNAPAVSKPIS